MSPSLCISFPVRFFIDENFIGDILQDKSVAVEIINKLSHIHRNSLDHPLTHNVIFDTSFKKSIADKLVRGPALLGAMHPVPFPNYIPGTEEFATKVIKHCIDMATRRPYKIIILTSSEQAKHYEANSHYGNGKVKDAILIAFGAEAIKHVDAIHEIGCLE